MAAGRSFPQQSLVKEGNTMSEKSYTVDTFCEAEQFTRAHLYNLWKRGEGPRFYTVGNRRRITEEMRREWQAKREAAAELEVA
jgi:tRNA G37 N-methylase TrmD